MTRGVLSQIYINTLTMHDEYRYDPRSSFHPTLSVNQPTFTMAIITPPTSQRRPPARLILSLDPFTKLLPSTSERNQEGSTILMPESTAFPQNDELRIVDIAKGSPCTNGEDTNAHEGGPEEDPSAVDEQHFGRSFVLYEQMQSTREVNGAIKAELLKCHPATEGCIYGFLHPSDTRIRIGSETTYNIQIIKIGRSVNVRRRMKEWRKKCKYVPLVVLNIEMPHHHRIERIVHHQLHNSRLREYPGCSGCGSQHNEWFRVSTIYAVFLVSMWRDFAHRQPYGKDGKLLPDWLERLNQVDLEDPGCWMWFILESFLTISPSPSTYIEGRGNGP